MTTRRINGATVRALRDALGIRHGELAKDVSISAGYLTRIEQGTQQPAPAVVRAIAVRLGVSLDAVTYPVAVPEPADQVAGVPA